MLDFSKFFTVDSSYRALKWVFAVTSIWGYATARPGWPVHLVAAFVAAFLANDVTQAEKLAGLVRMFYQAFGQPPVQKPNELDGKGNDGDSKQ